MEWARAPDTCFIASNLYASEIQPFEIPTLQLDKKGPLTRLCTLDDLILAFHWLVPISRWGFYRTEVMIYEFILLLLPCKSVFTAQMVLSLFQKPMVAVFPNMDYIAGVHTLGSRVHAGLWMSNRYAVQTGPQQAWGFPKFTMELDTKLKREEDRPWTRHWW